jgi:hypothetical protein
MLFGGLIRYMVKQVTVILLKITKENTVLGRVLVYTIALMPNPAMAVW